MKSAEIRKAFLEYFQGLGHEVVASSSLVPENDPTLLFTNAGMNQFKDVFLGNEVRNYTRATSSQTCVRAGGKHNDLDNVGYTARHHTFFEMLGNFSFGDYFKHDAIKYAWEFLTEVLKLPAERLWVTVYKDDKEAEAIWLNDIGIDPTRFSRLDEKDNFWSMGDTGPCGPCSEIFYDHGPDVAGGPPGSKDDDLDRYIEIWNLVFMQYERFADGSMKPLPKPSVDTGMGLERLSAVLQNVHANYEIDLFQNLLRAAADVTGINDLEEKSLRVIADHIRSSAFLIKDGVLPSNEGRGYVLRRIIRRALRHGHKLGAEDLFFYKLMPALVAEMGDAYPALQKLQPQIEKVLRSEEEKFAQTLDKGLKILDAELDKISGQQIPGSVVFKLYDTYGFPVDLTADIAREKNLEVDEAGFEQAMAEQREKARRAGTFDVDYTAKSDLAGNTVFEGYDALEYTGSVKYLLDSEGNQVDALAEGVHGGVVLDQTSFYAESGGQVGDAGVLLSDDNGLEFVVTNTIKLNDLHLHQGELKRGSLKSGDSLSAHVNALSRKQATLHHSATHLLHAALRELLGDHVQQKGSLVSSERLRFDFSHFEAVTPEQIKQLEQRVNDVIAENSTITTDVMDFEAAKSKGALALFGEKYTQQVRVLSMGNGFSVELCGGTHAKSTGDLGFFKIISESGTAAGVRRIEAVAGGQALSWVDNIEQRLKHISSLVRGSTENVHEKVEALVSRNRQLEKELEQLKSKLASAAGNSLVDQAVEIKGHKFLASSLEGADVKSLRETMDQLKNKLGSGIIILAAAEDNKVTLLAGVTKDLIKTVKAGDLVKAAAVAVDGRGGGKPELAQAGGKDAAKIPAALAAARDWLDTAL